MATAIFKSRPPDFFLCGFLKKNYLNNPRSTEELKHNNEQAVANTDPETLCIVARNILKIVEIVFELVVNIFSTCCKAVLQVLPNN
jgi:hypothetical protein